MSNLILPQKCLHLLDAKKVKKFRLDSPYAIFIKIDGWYLTIDYINGDWGQLTSSAGRVVPSLTYISSFFPQVKGITGDYRFIFEGTIPDLTFHEMNGRFNKKEEQVLSPILHLHDIIPLNNTSDYAFSLRYELAKNYIQNLEDVLEYKTELVKTLDITLEEDMFYFWFDQITSASGEGIVAKQLNAPYCPGKRNSSMLKLKEEVTLDLKVIGVERGKGKYEDTLGSLICQRKNGVIVTVSGMTDKQREEWWENSALIVNSIVEVRAMKELPDGTLYQPRFKLVRTDKTTGDID